MLTNPWTVESWKTYPAQQQPKYESEDQAELQNVLAELSQLPPVVTSWEVDRLRNQVAIAQAGNAWILQGGDCAESFAECHASHIASKLKVLLQMSLVLVFGSKQKIIRLGRIAGQYAKPRSSDTETRGDLTLPSYRGDIINRAEFDPASRRNDPQLLLQGYARSTQTMNYIRGLSEGGFADLHHTENWNLEFVGDSPAQQKFQSVVNSLRDSLQFIHTISDAPMREMERVDFFISHEALHLHYEQALTRKSIRRGIPGRGRDGSHRHVLRHGDA
ncbi:MAG: 3-deoxy-7-phosphoheptulonate synthase, partial [Planctomycetota bacterium]